MSIRINPDNGNIPQTYIKGTGTIGNRTVKKVPKLRLPLLIRIIAKLASSILSSINAFLRKPTPLEAHKMMVIKATQEDIKNFEKKQEKLKNEGKKLENKSDALDSKLQDLEASVARKRNTNNTKIRKKNKTIKDHNNILKILNSSQSKMDEIRPALKKLRKK